MIRRVTSRSRRLAVAVVVACVITASATPATHFVVVEGLGGTQLYAEQFREQLTTMLPALRSTAGPDARVIVLAGREATLERIGQAFLELATVVQPGDSLAVFLLGHGSHDGETYKLNVPGPDVTDRQLDQWLDGVPAAQQLVVSTTSSSGGALERLRSPSRIVITATKNGRERTATQFGEYWAEALGKAEADTNKNETISALEAFEYADGKVQAHFEAMKLLATEHAVLQGERAEGFVLARLGSMASLAADASTRPLLDQREDMEERIAALTRRKEEMSESEYLDALQALLLDLADLQEQIDARTERAEE